MHAGNIKIYQMSSEDYWILILRNLVALRDIGVKIILAVKFRKVCNLATNCKPDFYHMLYRFFIYNRQSPRVCHADRTNKGVGGYFWVACPVRNRRFSCGVLAATKHLR